MDHEKDKGVTGRVGDHALRVDPLHYDISKADMIPTHPYMLNQAVEALVRIYLAQAKHNPRLQNEYAFVLVMMAAAMFEAVVNLVLMEGFREPAAFYELEKSTPLAKWIALRGLGDIPDFSTEPAGGVRALFKVRNTIVHAKPDEGKKIIRQKGLNIVGVLRVASVDRMLASAVLASCDAVTRAPWNGRLDGSAVWAWPMALDNHGPLRWHLMHLPAKSITRTALLALAPVSKAK